MSRTISSTYKQKIKRWVELDNSIEMKKTNLKSYTDEKKALEDDILEYVEENDMQNVQITMDDGFLKFFESKGFQGISLKNLKDNLHRFFKERCDAVNSTASSSTPVSADEIYNYLVDKREVKTKLAIKRHITS